ncbi:MAG: Amuc_1098 family type IV pilus outer membrane protein [Terrimicrobiaceae bacterium]
MNITSQSLHGILPTVNQHGCPSQDINPGPLASRRHLFSSSPLQPEKCSPSQTSQRNSRLTFVLLVLICTVTGFDQAAAQNTAAIADREIVRRQEGVLIANQLVVKGDRAFDSKDYETAYVNYLDALENVPEGSSTSTVRAPIVAKFVKTALLYAQALIDGGRYADAERVAKTILLPQYDPENRAAVQILSNLEQPDHYNKTVTPQFAADRDQVLKLLEEGKGFFAAGRFDLAMKRYEQVLLIDRYNNAARMGMEQVNKQRSTYDANAYNETRSRLLWLVDEAWERPINRNLSARATDSAIGLRGDVRGNEAITAKLNRIIIPKIELRDTTVREAVDFLKQRSRDLDTSTDDPAQRRGVNIVLKLNPTSLAAPVDPNAVSPDGAVVAEIPEAEQSGTADTRITMSLTNVPLVEALRYLTELAKLKYKIEPFAVSIVPVTENTTDLVTKEYKVPPGFIPSSSASEDGGPIAGPGASLTDARIRGRTNAKAYLESQQVPFPEGSFAQYVPAGSKLVVRNTPDALDLIDYLVDSSMGVQPTQVEIESRFLEVTQNNLEELGFDWLLGPLAIGGGVYGAGGTEGFGTNLAPTSPAATTFPFTAGGTPVGQNPVTGGLRSGAGTGPNAAATANSIDALIAGIAQGATVAAPGIFGISGIFTNPQFQVVIRALSQKKGVDLMTAPKVTTKSGRKAVMRVVREFPYPTEFNPPEAPALPEGDSTIVLVPGSLVSGGIVTPTTPTQFEVRNIGVTLEVEPIIGPDNYTIDLNLSPEVVEFDGFVNYGSPILGAEFQFPNNLVPIVLTPNVINQPIFSTRKVTTSVSIWDGQTVGLGGLIREDVQKTEDKVPLLGDIPIAGRLFRSNVDQKIKRNLLIFVTARLMDAEGRPVRQDDADQEEIVEPLGLPADLPPPSFESRAFGK